MPTDGDILKTSKRARVNPDRRRKRAHGVRLDRALPDLAVPKGKQRVQVRATQTHAHHPTAIRQRQNHLGGTVVRANLNPQAGGYEQLTANQITEEEAKAGKRESGNGGEVGKFQAPEKLQNPIIKLQGKFNIQAFG